VTSCDESKLTNTLPDTVRRWTWRLAQLRAQAVKARRASPLDTLTENALEMCDALLRDLAGMYLERDKVRAELRARVAAHDHLFRVMPPACILTDGTGTIVNANRAAGSVLNLTAKHLQDRQLALFTGDRDAFTALLQRLPEGDGQLRATLVFRPRDRKPAAMDVEIVCCPEPVSGVWLWCLTPSMPTGVPIPTTVASSASTNCAEPN
jgi:PAS domain-containing protein